MQINRLIIAASIGVCVSFTAGCAQKEPAPRILLSDPRLKEALLLKAGSFFVYLDSLSSARDSFYVTDDAYWGYKLDEDKNIEYETVFQCVAHHATRRLTSIGYGAGTGQQDIISTAWAEESGDFVLEAGVLRLPFVEGEVNNEYGDMLTAIKYYPSYVNYGRTYNEVYEFSSKRDSVTTHTYYSLETGATIRFITNISGADRVYNLVNSQTIR